MPIFVSVALRSSPKESNMSKHHTLPPIIYTPPPKPKKIEKKRRPSIGMLSQLDEMAQAHETSGTGQPAPIVNRPPPQNFSEIEGAERKPQHPQGRLSESTLKAMLEVQEMK
jgi:hypothetical protein